MSKVQKSEKVEAKDKERAQNEELAVPFPPEVQLANEAFEETVIELIMKEPFYANLITNMRREFDVNIPTAGVNVTEQVNMYINPFFFCSLTLPQRLDLLKHECVFGDTKVSTDKGLIKIKDIVNRKLKVNVLSLSKNGELQYKPIISYSKQKEKDFPNKHWVSLTYSKSNYLYSTPVVTNDHRIGYLDHPFSTIVKYDKAENCEGKYNVRLIDNKRERNKEHPQYNSQQIEAIVGMVLGDSHIGEKRFSSVGSKKHLDYIKFKQHLLGGTLTPAYSGYTKKYTCVRVNHMFNAQMEFLRNEFYPKGKKTIKNILNYITPISLAYWFMDDGHWNNYGTSFFHTEGFSKKENIILKNFLAKKFGLNCEVKERDGRNLYCLKLKREATYKLFDIIAPYIHPSMNYKIPLNKRGEFSIDNVDNNYLPYSIRKILKVRKRKGLRSALYDIGVADNHNFFGNSGNLHNCHHVLNNHFVRFRDLEPKIFEKKEQTIFDKIETFQKASDWNRAADTGINEYLPNLPRKINLFDKEGNKILVPKEIKDPKTGQMIPNPDKNVGKPIEGKTCVLSEMKKDQPNVFNSAQHHQTMEYYYEFFKQKREDDSKNGDKMDQFIVIDDHDLWHKSDASEDSITEKVKEVVNKAVEQTGDRSMGKMPNEVLQAIEALNHVPKDWRQDIQRFAARSAEIKIESTRKRRNRRYGIMYPGFKTYPLLHLGVGMDTSGSVCDESLGQFHSEILRLHNMGIKITVIECDVKVNAVYEFNPKKPFEVHGRGGTAFKPVFDHIDKEKLDVDGLIYFTDGACWGEEIKKPKYGVLWALTAPFQLDASVKFGSKTKIEIKKRVKR